MNPHAAVNFSTFAYYRVRGAVMDGVRDSAYLSRRAYRRLVAAEAADRISEEASEAQTGAASAPGSAAATIESALTKISASYVISALGQDEHRETESPEDTAVAASEAQRVRSLLATLPERERALVRGFYFEGRRFDEVAQDLGISKSWASRLHSKALARLREKLEEP